MFDLLAEFVGLGISLAIVLFLVGAWQHTRCSGFLWLAASFALDRLISWAVRAVFYLVDNVEGFYAVFPLFPLLSLGLAAVGCALIYRHLRPAPADAP